MFAGTSKGVARWNGQRWEPCFDRQGRVLAILPQGDSLLVAFGDELVQGQPATGEVAPMAPLPPKFATAARASLAVAGGTIYLGGDAGLFALEEGQFAPVEGFQELVESNQSVRQLAAGADGELAVAAAEGLFVRSASGEWRAVKARSGKRSWYPHDVRAVAYDRAGRLWFGSVQGVGCREGDRWSLYTGEEGLPYDDFTTCAAGEPGVVWFGTKIGAIRFDGTTWSYRQGRRWAPDDVINAIAVEDERQRLDRDQARHRTDRTPADDACSEGRIL